MIIDLRSDTVTRPTKGMLNAMFSAKVGDDVFGEDETVNELEKKAAALFGKEAGLFCPSGTMTNQVAIKVHTRSGDEVICDKLSHIYLYEGGGIAANSGAAVQLLEGNRGRFTAADVLGNIKRDDVHFPKTSLVSIENTMNRGGGACWDINEIKNIAAACKDQGLKLHLDGARIYNALVAQKISPQEMGSHFDSVSLCLSKGLGAPVGSVLLGSDDFIRRARRVRKVFGGGMRQAGFLAAAGIYALDNHVERIAEDHKRAKILEEALMVSSFVQQVFPVETNIILFTVKGDRDQVAAKFAEHSIRVSTMGKNDLRFVTHLDYTDEMLEKTLEVIKKMN